MRVTYRNLVWLAAFSIFFALLAATVSAQQTSGTQTATKQSATTAAAQPTAAKAGMPSAAEIASAKKGGKVWVNLDTGIYHKGGRWYGKTKNGRFMTESEAKAAGYRKSKRN